VLRCKGEPTMQVTETLNEGLRREFRVVVPAAVLEQQLTERLTEMGSRAQIRGFRRGKVPVTHLRRLYGRSMMADVIQKQVEDSSRDALAERNIKPAYPPEIALPQEQTEVSGIIEGKSDLAFTMSFEVVPPVEIADFSALELTRHVVPVEEREVEEALARVAAQQRTYAEKDGPAENGDRVIISFTGRVDGEVFEGGTAEQVPLDIGSGQFIPGFEEKLVGAKAGDEVKVEVTFPEDYSVTTLRGKPAVFDVKIEKVEAGSDLPEDQLAERLGIESIDKVRTILRDRIAEELGNMTHAKLKRDMLDALDKQYSFELPTKLVDAEFNQIWSALEREMKRSNQTFAAEGTTEQEAREEYRKIAERRVRLGLVLGTIGEQAAVTVSDEEIDRALIRRARQFPRQERQVYEFYRKNPSALMEIRGPLFEEKVIDYIAGRANIKEVTTTREELAKLIQDDEEFDDQLHDHDHDHDHEHGHDHHHHDHDHGHDHDHDHDDERRSS
jgi:trigger factor